MNTTRLMLAGTAMALAIGSVSTSAWAGVSADEAAKLKTTLTPFGAERAANKDGTIPAWDGGYTKVPAGYKNGETRPDPFAAEKPLFSITGKNADQYADKLSEATLALLKKYPTYRVDVYPTHRSATAPQWVFDNTFKNATRAKLENNGMKVEGAFGGIPFPIPKSGDEVLWNHRLTWISESVQYSMRTWVVNADGKRNLATGVDQFQTQPYYYKDASLESTDGIYVKARQNTLEPAYKAGEALLIHEPLDLEKRAGWQYLVGQRRVRRAPSIGYDTPNFVTSGIGIFDEVNMLLGPTDRHAMKLVGKKEMFIPYNANRAGNAKPDELMQAGHLNPDHVRWELHRVWVVEGTLIPGKRHVVSKRRYYVDEDSWQIALSDGWDAQGVLWRGGFSLSQLMYDIPSVSGFNVWGSYDLRTGSYFLNTYNDAATLKYKVVSRPPENFYTPEELANQGGR